MPKLRDSTIAAHKQGVRAAVLDAAGELVAEHGLRGLTMSRLAERAGIGRATLYKYFPHVEAVLDEWHDRQVRGHLEQLHALAGRAGPLPQRLRQVLAAHASLRRRAAQHGDADAVAALHRGSRLAEHEGALRSLLTGLVRAGAGEGAFRRDVPPDELALFALRALDAARSLPTDAAVDRLLDVVLAALSRQGEG